jgi:adenylate kinase family enzyme
MVRGVRWCASRQRRASRPARASARADAPRPFAAPREEVIDELTLSEIEEIDLEPLEGGQTGTLVRRKDDEPEAIRKRMQVYRDQTAPVIDWYASNGANMVRVNALGTLADVESRVHAALGIS